MKPEEFNKKLKESPFVITTKQHQRVDKILNSIFDDVCVVSLVENGSFECRKYIDSFGNISPEKEKFIFETKLGQYIDSLDVDIKYTFEISPISISTLMLKFNACL